jgi:hypothetical protein
MNAFRADSLTAYIHENSKKMAAAAATAAAAIIVDSIEARGLARVIWQRRFLKWNFTSLWFHVRR